MRRSVRWSQCLRGCLLLAAAACGDDDTHGGPSPIGMGDPVDASADASAPIGDSGVAMEDAADQASDAALDAAPAADAAAAPGEAAVDAGGDASARAPWLIEPGDKVFFVGNSFFGGEDDRLSDWVTAIGTAVQPPFPIETGEHIVYGNMPLSWFFQQPESQAAISSGEYKMFVLQGEEREPVDNRAVFKQAVRDYHAAVTANGGRIMLFMTWDFYWERETDFFERLVATYEEIGAELNVPVIPIGLIYDDCNKDPYGDEQPYWLTGQELHQNNKGTAANAYATFAMLTGINPMGQTFIATRNDNPPELLKYLSDKAWVRVVPRLDGSFMAMP